MEKANLCLCETVVANLWHLRKVSSKKPKLLSGSDGSTYTLCDLRVGWDIDNNNLRLVSCLRCAELAGEKR